MPIYEYACNACGHRFELLQRMGAEAPDACPECAAGSVKKLVSATNFMLKGSGWYRDSYGLKPGGSNTPAGEHKSDASPNGASGDKATTDKPSSDKPSSDKPSSDKPAGGSSKGTPPGGTSSTPPASASGSGVSGSGASARPAMAH